MKYILTLILAAWCFSASAQHGYISSSGDVILESGSIEIYASPYIYVDFDYHTTRQVWITTLSLTDAVISANGLRSKKTFQIEFDAATIDAITMSGATNTEKISNGILQAVEDYLIVLNGSIFTLN